MSIYVIPKTTLMKGPDLKFMEKLGKNPYLKCNISSSNQVKTINEAPLDSRGFFE